MSASYIETQPLYRNFFSGFEEDVDVLFMRYFRNRQGEPTIIVQGNPVKAYFFNEYVALRQQNKYPEFPAIIITPFAPKESKDYPFYVAPFIRKAVASDGTITFYKFESLVWKDFQYQVDAVSKDYLSHKRLHALLSNKLFPRIAGSRYFKVQDGEYRPLSIIDVKGWDVDPDGTYKSTITYEIKIPVWETEPIIQGSTVSVRLELMLSDLSLQVIGLNKEDSHVQDLSKAIIELFRSRHSMSEEELERRIHWLQDEIQHIQPPKK